MGRRWRFVDLRACARSHSSRRAYASACKTSGVELAEADEREVAERRHRAALDEIGGRRSAGPALEARPWEFRPPTEPLRDGLEHVLERLARPPRSAHAIDDHQLPTRPQHAQELIERDFGMGHGVDNILSDHNVEG